MTDQPLRPQPSFPEPDTEPFWEATKRRELTYQTCDDCGEVVFYPRAHCTSCGSGDGPARPRRARFWAATSTGSSCRSGRNSGRLVSPTRGRGFHQARVAHIPGWCLGDDAPRCARCAMPTVPESGPRWSAGSDRARCARSCRACGRRRPTLRWPAPRPA